MLPQFRPINSRSGSIPAEGEGQQARPGVGAASSDQSAEAVQTDQLGACWLLRTAILARPWSETHVDAHLGSLSRLTNGQ